MMKFINYKIPNIQNKTIIITGANSGIGFYVAKTLANHGAKIIFACRNKTKAQAGIKTILKQNKNAQCYYIHLDLSSFKSIKKFTNTIKQQHPIIDVLINNAGVIMQNSNNRSKDGFEPHIATNCLGPFLLTQLLLDCIKKSPTGRIVTLSSFAEKTNYFNLNKFPNLKGWNAYNHSKLANLILSYNLNNQLKKDGLTHIKAIACHPGLTDTPSKQLKYLKPLLKPFSMPIEQGAMSSIVAATSTKLKGGEYLGYDKFFNLSGNVSTNKSSKITYNKVLAKQLYTKCKNLTNL